MANPLSKPSYEGSQWQPRVVEITLYSSRLPNSAHYTPLGSFLTSDNLWFVLRVCAGLPAMMVAVPALQQSKADGAVGWRPPEKSTVETAMPDSHREINVDKAETEAFAARARWENPDWDIIQPTRTPAPTLPLDCFGAWQSTIVKLALSASAPPDYVAFGFLTHAAGLIGNLIKVRPSAKRSPNWVSPTALWTALVGPPSSGKTPALQPFKTIIGEIEQNFEDEYRPKIRERESVAEVAKIKERVWRQETRNAIKKGETPDERPKDSIPPPKINVPIVRVMDITIEKLADVLNENPNGVLVYREELYGFFINMGRYSNGNDQPMWLELHDGGTVIVDRKNREERLKITNALVSILGGIQPDRLDEVVGGADDGLFARFIYVAPDIPLLNDTEIDIDYGSLKYALKELRMAPKQAENETDEFNYLFDFSDDAADEFFEFRKRIRTLAGAREGLMAGWVGKAPGLVARLTTVLFLLDWVLMHPGQRYPKHLPLEYARRAIRLWEEYLLPMTERAFAGHLLPKHYRAARRILLEAKESGTSVINEREFKRKLKSEGLFENHKKGECPFLLLRDAGWLLDEFSRQGGSKGRRKKDWRVNPLLFGPIGANDAIGADSHNSE
ncbi:MAG: DUF3987 domain-containing protein [Pseudomonadota bacterium]